MPRFYSIDDGTTHHYYSGTHDNGGTYHDHYDHHDNANSNDNNINSRSIRVSF